MSIESLKAEMATLQAKIQAAEAETQAKAEARKGRIKMGLAVLEGFRDSLAFRVATCNIKLGKGSPAPVEKAPTGKRAPMPILVEAGPKAVVIQVKGAPETLETVSFETIASEGHYSVANAYVKARLAVEDRGYRANSLAVKLQKAFEAHLATA